MLLVTQVQTQKQKLLLLNNRKERNNQYFNILLHQDNRLQQLQPVIYLGVFS